MWTGRGTDCGVIHIKIIITLVVINGNRTVNVVYNAVMRTRSGINIYTVRDSKSLRTIEPVFPLAPIINMFLLFSVPKIF